MVQIKVDIAARKNYGNRRKTKDIKYLVIHYTGNDGDSAKGNANYFKTHIVEASAHYFVDDNGIIQSVPDDFAAYSVGGKKYPSCGKTGGGKEKTGRFYYNQKINCMRAEGFAEYGCFMFCGEGAQPVLNVKNTLIHMKKCNIIH